MPKYICEKNKFITRDKNQTIEHNLLSEWTNGFIKTTLFKLMNKYNREILVQIYSFKP